MHWEAYPDPAPYIDNRIITSKSGLTTAIFLIGPDKSGRTNPKYVTMMSRHK
jgi:hypothetical protein